MVTQGGCLNQVEDFLSLGTGVEVFYRCWFPSESKDVVVGVHGLAEHSGRYTHLGEYLANLAASSSTLIPWAPVA